MPRISLWNKNKTNDYKYIDRMISQHFYHGGTGVYIHKYIEPKDSGTPSTGSGVFTIDDVLFLENRSRKYDDNIYESRAHYNPSDSDFDLSQFGIFLTNDTILLTFHLNDVVDLLGRKLLSGDVLELPHLRDDTLLDPNKNAVNRFYSVEDVTNYAQGYDAHWWPHIIRIKAKKLVYSENYKDIFDKYKDENSDNDCQSDLAKDLANVCESEKINDAIEEEAASYVKYDPKFFENEALYIEFYDNGMPALLWCSSNAIPPNGEPLYGEGSTFPDDTPDGAYFLRTDFVPNRLYKRNGNKFLKVGDDLKKPWKPGHQVLDSFINNDKTTTLNNGTVVPEKQALSKVLKPKADE